MTALTGMRSYWWKTGRGRYHVQNMVAGMQGQEHAHTRKQFLAWCEQTEAETQIEIVGISTTSPVRVDWRNEMTKAELEAYESRRNSRKEAPRGNQQQRREGPRYQSGH